jgi:hypothetical protein
MLPPVNLLNQSFRRKTNDEAQTVTKPYVTCKTGGIRPGVANIEMKVAPRKPVSGHETSDTKCGKEGRFASRMHIQGICPERMFFDIL